MGSDPDAIRQSIEATRESMSETLDALAYKADVPGRVKEQVHLAAAAATEVAMAAGDAVQATAGNLRKRPDVDALAGRLAKIDSRISAAVGIFALGYIAGLLVGRR